MTTRLLIGAAAVALTAIGLSACAGRYHEEPRVAAASVQVCNDQACYDVRFRSNRYRYYRDRYWYRDNDNWVYWHSDRHCWARDRDDWRSWRDDHRDWEDRDWPADWHYRWESCS